MLKRTLLTMTAFSNLVLIGPALNDAAMAGPNIKPSIRITVPQMKMRIDTRRLATRREARESTVPAAQAVALQSARAKAGLPPEPPTRQILSVQQIADVPPLPRPRPYDEFAEAGNDTGIGPDTGLSQDDKPFDEEQLAAIPAFWGERVFDILSGLGHGALDGAFENAPDAVDPFAPGNNRSGDLAGYNPAESIEPGGPNDPNVRDQIPSFFADPFNRNGNGDSHGYSSPSQAFGDRSNWASDGDLPNQQWMSDNGAIPVGTHVEPGENGHTTWIDMWKTPGSWIFYTEETDEDGNVVSGSAIQETTIGNGEKRIRRHFNRDENGDYQFVGDEIVEDEDIPDDEDSQPGVDPSTQEQAAAQAWICNTTPWMCRGGGGGSTPDEMLTQPAQPGDGADSIMDTDDGPALGREAVTNPNPVLYQEGNGGGGGSSSTPDEKLGQPGPDGPGGPLD